MIESGSHTPGVRADAFGLPVGTALRYERPAPALAGLVMSYGVVDADMDLFRGPNSWMLPGWAQIWIMLSEQPVGITMGSRRYDAIAPATLYGVTSRAMPVTHQGGPAIVADISPLGWARFFDRPADALRDRITPLDQMLPGDGAAELVARLRASDRGPAVKGILDDFFLGRLPPPHPREPLIAAIAQRLVDEETPDIAALADSLGLTTQTLLRLTKRYFGFPPKVLTRRARFLRAMAAMLVADGPPDLGHVPRGYHDASHFIRDAQHFLGMTPRRFMAMEMPFLRAALRARSMVFAVPTPSLDRPGQIAA